MKKIIGVVVVGVAVALVWHFGVVPRKYATEIVEDIKSGNALESFKKEVFTSTPLFSNADNKDSKLTVNGVVEWTNQNRKENGNLGNLKLNTKLNLAAQAKIKDMFNNQYFEHESPSGKGPADLVDNAGYSYIAIGENLALGNFKDDEDLVTAWMNSPGHRANILNTKFTEIGVAVSKGMFKGKMTWMAVQEFGKPSSSCPSVKSSLKQSIVELQNEVDALKIQLDEQKKQIDQTTPPQAKEEYDTYNKKISEYNNSIKIYNNKVDVLKSQTAEYNTQVDNYNKCLKS